MSRPTDHKRHRLIAELRAAGMTYREIGERFGITWQAVQQSLRLSGNTRTVPILCRKCKTVITQMRAVNHSNALVYCMNCLPRGATFGERLNAGDPSQADSCSRAATVGRRHRMQESGRPE